MTKKRPTPKRKAVAELPEPPREIAMFIKAYEWMGRLAWYLGDEVRDLSDGARRAQVVDIKFDAEGNATYRLCRPDLTTLRVTHAEGIKHWIWSQGQGR